VAAGVCALRGHDRTVAGVRRAGSASGLWGHPDFLKLWSGQTISLLGSSVTELALPLTAAVLLGATPSQMGVVRAAQYAPFLLLGLFAGVWVDRLRRRRLLIVADLGRALLLGSVPVAAVLGVLGMEYLYVVAFAVGVLTVFFDVAYLAYVPTLVPRAALPDANGKFEVSRSLALTVGPALAGVVVQIATASVALAVDAMTFVVSAAAVGFIRAAEPAASSQRDPAEPVAPVNRRVNASVWRDIGEGLRLVGREPVLRALAGQLATLQLGGGINGALFVLFALRELHVTPVALGVVTSVFGVVALLTSLLLGRAVTSIGERRTLVGSLLLTGVGNVCIPLAGLFPAGAVPLLLIRSAIHGVSGPAFNVASVSLRQKVVPDRLQGRVSATIRFVGWGILPASALAGGFLGERLGLLGALTVATCLSLTTFLWPLLVMPRVIAAGETADWPDSCSD
jgi:MFS family permease